MKTFRFRVVNIVIKPTSPTNINNTNDAINSLLFFISLLIDVTIKKAISPLINKYNPDINFIVPATRLVGVEDDDIDKATSPMEDIALPIELLDDVDDILPVPGIYTKCLYFYLYNYKTI